tara:strand:+ start:9063 stop:10088 length:1026 start_codon:yes stop_codon:yes gene_type:complete
MYANEKKVNKLFLNWLSISLLLVFSIIIVGGLTRLTNSGLSITEWELFSGILPPLNESEWVKYFDQYKQIPQYQLLNFDMSLDDFKVIFYWEYYHRILARIIGIFFLIPLILFYFSRRIRFEYIKICYLIFSLIVFQGVVGWFMVKSGLVDDITVSHYRLSIHLTTAVIILSIIFWLIKNVSLKFNKAFFIFNKNNLPFQILILLIFFQLVIGAFVSGLDAGKIYQTWPKMGNTFFPNDLILDNLKNMFEFDNHSLVQFYHRTLAYIIILYSIFLSILIVKKKMFALYKPLKIVIFFIFLQVALGILTLISGLNIYLASLHQIIGVFLVLSAINLYYFKVN